MFSEIAAKCPSRAATRAISAISENTSYTNVHEMALDMEGFVQYITTFPNLVVICGLKQILDEMEFVLNESCIDQLLSYNDTTFTMGDFYVSILIFRNTLFLKNPCIIFNS